MFRFSNTITEISKDIRNNINFIVSDYEIIDFDQWSIEERKVRVENDSKDKKLKMSPDSINFKDEKYYRFIEFKYRAKSNINAVEEVDKLIQKGTDGVVTLNNIFRKYVVESKLRKLPKPKLEEYYVVYSSEKQNEFEMKNRRLSAKKRIVNQILSELSRETNFRFISEKVYLENLV
jgi:hypothetical protein